jgi:hypothetical protein
LASNMRLNFVLQEFFGLCAHYFANFPSYTRPDGSVAITRYRPLGSEETSIPARGWVQDSLVADGSAQQVGDADTEHRFFRGCF